MMIDNCTIIMCVPCGSFNLTCHVVHVLSTAEEPTPSQTVKTVPVSIQPTNNPPSDGATITSVIIVVAVVIILVVIVVGVVILVVLFKAKKRKQQLVINE